MADLLPNADSAGSPTTSVRRLRSAVASTNAIWVIVLRGLTALALYLAVRSESVDGADYRFLAFVVSFISISQNIDFGLGGALTQLATRLQSDRDTLRAVRALVNRASAAIGGASAIFVTGLLIAMPESAVGLSGRRLYATAVVLGISTGMNVRASGLERTLIGLGHYRLAMTASAGVAAITAVAVFGVAWQASIFPNLSAAIFISALMRQLAAYACVRHVDRTARDGPGVSPRAQLSLRELGKNSAIFFGLQVIFFLSFQTDTLIVNAFGGVNSTRTYATSLRFFTNIPGVVAVIALPLWRSLAATVMDEQLPLAWTKFKRAERIIVLGSVSASIAVALVLLVGSNALVGSRFSLMMALVWIAWSALLSWGQIIAFLLASLTLVPFQLALSTLMMIANVALSIWATHVFGAIGPALGTVASYALVLVLPARTRARRACLVGQH